MIRKIPQSQTSLWFQKVALSKWMSWRLLITFANSLDPDQGRQVGTGFKLFDTLKVLISHFLKRYFDPPPQKKKEKKRRLPPPPPPKKNKNKKTLMKNCPAKASERNKTHHVFKLIWPNVLYNTNYPGTKQLVFLVRQVIVRLASMDVIYFV